MIRADLELLSISANLNTFLAPNKAPVPAGTLAPVMASAVPPNILPIAPTVGLIFPNGISLKPIDLSNKLAISNIFSSAVFVKSCDTLINSFTTPGSFIPVMSINLDSDSIFDKYLTSFIPPGSLLR